MRLSTFLCVELVRAKWPSASQIISVQGLSLSITQRKDWWWLYIFESSQSKLASLLHWFPTTTSQLLFHVLLPPPNLSTWKPVWSCQNEIFMACLGFNDFVQLLKQIVKFLVCQMWPCLAQDLPTSQPLLTPVLTACGHNDLHRFPQQLLWSHTPSFHWALALAAHSPWNALPIQLFYFHSSSFWCQLKVFPDHWDLVTPAVTHL